MLKIYSDICNHVLIYICKSWDTSVGIGMSYKLDGLGLIQLRIQCVLEAFSIGLKQRGHEADHTPASSAEV
jgi:hypothetical protein